MSRTAALLAEIARTGSTRESIALVYRDGIRANLEAPSSDVVDWPTVNAALLQRYTVSGLDYIKKRAWDAV
jgi:hypothetical protein